MTEVAIKTPEKNTAQDFLNQINQQFLRGELKDPTKLQAVRKEGKKYEIWITAKVLDQCIEIYGLQELPKEPHSD